MPELPPELRLELRRQPIALAVADVVGAEMAHRRWRDKTSRWFARVRRCCADLFATVVATSRPGLFVRKHIVLVDMYTGFNTSTMLGSDSIHPNTTGYTFMADHWYSVIGSLLPK